MAAVGLHALHALTLLIVFPSLADSVALTQAPQEEVEWSYGGGYTGTVNWFSILPVHCAEGLQSPINIVTKLAKEMSFDFLRPIGFTSQDRPTGAILKVENNGHTVELHTIGEFFIEGGGLAGKQYRVSQLHFHWGHPNSPGSEHTMNGKRYDAEMHIVSYDTQYPSLLVAKDNTDGVAVFSALIQIGINPNYQGSTFEKLMNGVKTLAFKGDEHFFQGTDFNLRGLLPDNIDWFYRYRGSFTTPPCDSHVVWTVWEQTLVVPQSTMDVFYNLNLNKATDPTPVKLRDNFRPVQVATDRDLFHSHRNNW